MARWRMALLTKQWWPFHKQGGVIAAVRSVAKSAVFRSRRVFPQKGPAFLCVADVAGFIDGRLLQQKIVVAIVRIVAIAACHAAESQWMIAGLPGI